MSILGLHHITLVCENAQKTVDFYTKILGLKFVKKTVNFDDPSSYHIYFGNETASVGSAITFFEWPHAPKGRAGVGGTHHFAMTVESYEALLKWKQWLKQNSVAALGPKQRGKFASIYFHDPDGCQVELATKGEAVVSGEVWGEPVAEITRDMKITEGMHHITAESSNLERTHEFFGDLLGMNIVNKVPQPEDSPLKAHWFWGVGEGKPGTLMSYIEKERDKTQRARMGIGQTHHFALAVKDAETQLEWREKIIRAGVRCSPVMERVYFKSIYTSDPDGHIVELATAGPGFTADEPLAEMGKNLRLPPWMENQRRVIEQELTPIL